PRQHRRAEAARRPRAGQQAAHVRSGHERPRGLSQHSDRRLQTMKSTGLAAAASVLALAGCALPGEPTGGTLRPAMEKFLAERGDLCLGKYDWPIEVSERDFQAGTRDAVQLPVLEKAGIVRSSTQARTTRYELTEAGRKFYIERETTHVTA